MSLVSIVIAMETRHPEKLVIFMQKHKLLWFVEVFVVLQLNLRMSIFYFNHLLSALVVISSQIKKYRIWRTSFSGFKYRNIEFLYKLIKMNSPFYLITKFQMFSTFAVILVFTIDITVDAIECQTSISQTLCNWRMPKWPTLFSCAITNELNQWSL